MIINYKDVAPFFRNGRLYLPMKTVEMLTDVGLSAEISQNALNGLDLADHREQIAVISKALETLLENMEENTREFHALNSSETRFLLTGKPSPV
ncbi:MAG: hypothetical protein R3E39_14090 [Anaerolineae bacterium]